MCDECTAVIPSRAKECLGRGAPVPTRTAVEHEPGELIELGTRRCGGKIELTIADKAIFYAELRGYAQTRGYAAGWVAHKYRERFRVWPDDLRI